MHEFIAIRVSVTFIGKLMGVHTFLLVWDRCDQEADFRVYDHAPVCLQQALFSDCIGVFTPRRNSFVLVFFVLGFGLLIPCQKNILP